MYDILIKNGTIVDGSGGKSYKSNIACSKEKITILECGTEPEAREVIDATGKMIFPGFIDAHTHGDVPLGQEFASLAKISQGITTQVAGMCGMSVAPVNPKYVSMLQDSMGMLAEKFPPNMHDFTTFEKYLKYVDTLSTPENTKFLIGHLTLRVAAMGYENREPTKAELDNMKSMLEEALQAGAGGLSSGLVYVPSAYGKEPELTELCKVVEKYGGIYTTHMRNEANDCIKSVGESINTARNSGVNLIISHHKHAGKQNWGNSKITLKMIEDANNEGLSVNLDQYPYRASMTQLSVCAPPKYYTKGLEGMAEYLKDPAVRAQIKEEMNDPTTDYDNYYLNSGGWSGVLIAKSVNMPDVEGMTIQEYAEKKGMDPFDIFCEVMIANRGVATAIYFEMCDEDIFNIIKYKRTVVGTDGILRAASDKPHPRAFGTFPHAIRVFVKEQHILTLEEMIHKMTGLTAEVTKVPYRGLIKDGYYADLLVVDYEKLTDKADYVNPKELCEGIDYVIVNGAITYNDKKLSGQKPGHPVLMK